VPCALTGVENQVQVLTAELLVSHEQDDPGLLDLSSRPPREWVTIMQRANERGWWFDWRIYARAVDAPRPTTLSSE
jgi:hypothetical protein